jgi:hypothetical protein
VTVRRSLAGPILPLVIRRVAATRYVTPLREGGSLPAIVEADDDGMYVAKFRGAGHGSKALVAEVVAGEIGRALGLPIPEIVLVDFDPRLAAAEPDGEIRDLLARSAGLNAGLDFLPGSLGYDPATGFSPAPDLCAAVVWFDSFVTNVDRDARNTNMLVWHGRLWLIDHGSALYVHHGWHDPLAHARRPLPALARHVLLPKATSIVAADARLAPLLSRELFISILDLVPAEWLAPEPGLPDPAAHRAAYLGYLLTRLESHRELAEEADRVRVGA